MGLNRHDYILKCIVDYFVKTATPVGSSTLIEKYDLPYSSATIRNEMAILESQGYIEKTHISSGRVPSSKGYKYYVEHLRTSDLDSEIKANLTKIIDRKAKSVEDVIKESCEMISHMTNLASVVLGPNADEEHLVSIQVIPLSANSASAIFVTDKGYVENKTFVLDPKANINDIKQCVEMINKRLVGTPISGLIEKMELMKPLLETMIKSNDLIYKAFMEAFVKFASDRVSLFGKENLFEQPEFIDDTSKLKQMMKFIESPSEVEKVMRNDKEMNVQIGFNLEDGDELDDVAMVTKKIPLGNGGKGTIALVGPKRMDYELVLNALDYLSEELEKFFDDDF